MLDQDLYPLFRDAQLGDKLERPVLITSVADATSRNGDNFVKISMKDGVTEERSNVFNTSVGKLAVMGIKKDTVADVKITIGEYRGRRSVNIEDIRPCADPNITPMDFCKLPPIDMDVMYDEICALLESCADDMGGTCTPLSKLALTILQENRKGYMHSSAAVSMHHNMRGGLLYHSYRMVKAADAICNVYTDLDRELLLCGTALHDIGKIWEYQTTEDGSASFTKSVILFGHLYMGASLIKKYTDGENYNLEKVQLLIHLILSHHGLHEWGAVSCPAIPEAFALHYIDNLDAKIYACEDKFDALHPGELTADRPFGMPNYIYKPDYGE